MVVTITYFGCKGKDFVWNEQGLLVEYGKLIRCDEDLGRSTVAHFARKVRGANIVAAKHELIIQQSHAKSVGHVRYVFVALTLRAK